MKDGRVTELPGEKLRRAVEEFCELKRRCPEKSTGDLLDRVATRFDLSPAESEFLRRQLNNSC